MIFNEIYSAYYRAVGAIIGAILEGDITERDMQRIISENAFAESSLAIIPALKSGKWQLIHSDLSTPLEHKPSIPVTNLEKRWLKAISLDRRIRLFGVEFKGLEDVEPLFTEEDYRVYDRYGNGDPYEDESYIRRFRLILEAIRGGLPIKLEMVSRRGTSKFLRCIPRRLEYSEKDDKLRVLVSGERHLIAINLARITKCSLYRGDKPVMRGDALAEKDEVTLEITDERNTLERVMLHFAHFERRAEDLGEGKYLLTVKYNKDDVTELVIRILSFGPMVRVVSPDSFLELIRERLKKQQSCGLF